MHSALQALTDELKRLKSLGVKEVSVSEETMSGLRRAIQTRGKLSENPPLVVAETMASGRRTKEKISTATSPRAEENISTPIEKRSVKNETATVTKAATFTTASPFELPAGDKKTRWDALYRLVTEDPVCRARVRPGKKVVLGVGNLDAKIFFCGEAPGAEEEEQGEPFVGPAGQLLTKMIQGMGLSRADVYIGNIMNWRPELPLAGEGQQVGNRPPNADEMAYCLPYLKAQLEIVNPEVIVALGSTATQGLLGAGSFKTLGEIRSQWKLFADKPVMVTYHPSYILRNPINRSKRAIWEDLLKVMERVALPISDKQRAFFLDK